MYQRCRRGATPPVECWEFESRRAVCVILANAKIAETVLVLWFPPPSGQSPRER